MNGFWKRKCNEAKEKERKSQKVVVRKYPSDYIKYGFINADILFLFLFFSFLKRYDGNLKLLGKTAKQGKMPENVFPKEHKRIARVGFEPKPL